jgi:hypothetical protein
MSNFRTNNWDLHLIDNAGNHFINKKCVNPKTTDNAEIGSTYPDQSEITALPEVTAKAK